MCHILFIEEIPKVKVSRGGMVDSISPWGVIRFQVRELGILQTPVVEGLLLGPAPWDSVGALTSWMGKEWHTAFSSYFSLKWWKSSNCFSAEFQPLRWPCWFYKWAAQPLLCRPGS